MVTSTTNAGRRPKRSEGDSEQQLGCQTAISKQEVGGDPSGKRFLARKNIQC
jgi:hypothetical protein